MSPEELDGIARAVNQRLGIVVADVLRQCDERIAAQMQAHAAELAEVRRSAEADTAAVRGELTETRHALGLAQQQLEALRASTADPIVDASLGADGTVRIVQRNGRPITLALPDARQLARDEVGLLGDALTERLRGEMHAGIARTFEIHYNAPAWSAAAVYAPGDIVQGYIGRTYRLRSGIKASMGKEPGEHPDHWERLGTGGFRTLKSRPAAAEPGDMFAEADARFVHDGAQTVLLVPKGVKGTDVERAVKGPQNMAQAAQTQAREVDVKLGGVIIEVQRTAAAANDASELSAQAIVSSEELRAEVQELRAVIEQLKASGGGK